MKYKKCRQLPASTGFTLIEVLVVVVIVGILGGIAAPGWLGYLSRQRVRSVRDELKAVVQDAQTTAQQKSTSYGVVIGSSSNGPTAALVTDSYTAPPVTLGSGTKNVRIETYVNSTASTDPLVFDYRGGVSEDLIPFVLSVTSDNNSATKKCLIVTSLLGGIVEAENSECDNPNVGV